MTRERLTFGHGAHRAVPTRVVADASVRADDPGRVRLLRIDTWDWGWGGLLIFTVLLFFRPQDQIPGLKNAHLSDIAAVIGLIGMVTVNLARRQPIARMTPELLSMLALGLVVGLTIPMSFWPTGSLDVFVNLYLPILLIVTLMVNTITSPKRIERMVWVIVLAFGYMSARVIFDYMRGVNVMGGRAMGPVGGFFSNPNDLALNLVAFLPLVVMYVKRPGAFGKRVLCVAIAAMMLVAMVFTKSRGGTLGAVAMLAAFFYVARLITPATIIAGVLAGMLVLPAMPDSFWDRMASITDAQKDETGSREERRLLLIQGVEVFLENPLTGIGAGQFQNYWRPGLAKKWHEVHNVLLQVAAEVGIFGLIAFSFLIVRAFTASIWTKRRLDGILRRRSRSRGDADLEDGLDDQERTFLHTHATAMIAAMVGWFVCALFLSVAFNWTFYYLLGLSVTARDVVRARERAYAEAKRRGEVQVVAA